VTGVGGGVTDGALSNWQSVNSDRLPCGQRRWIRSRRGPRVAAAGSLLRQSTLGTFPSVLRGTRRVCPTGVPRAVRISSVVVARVAQSVEHILGKDEVTGSIPVACLSESRVMQASRLHDPCLFPEVSAAVRVALAHTQRTPCRACELQSGPYNSYANERRLRTRRGPSAG
jgi:hypothetical protein